jgi:tRNA splicing ligase
MSYIDDLRANEYVREKDLGDGVSSFNFTRQAFFKGIWDDQTIHARGLFTKNGEVYARSYDKFFAVIDPINDPHIVEYKEEHVVLLNVMKNDFNCITFWDFTNEELSKKCGIPCKSLDYICEDEQTFLDWYKTALEEKDIEGYVCEDSNCYMFKVKNDWYKYWKRMRSVVQAIASERHSPEAIKQRYRLTKDDESLFNFMLEYVPVYIDRNLKVPDIITVRNAYYNHNSGL